VQPRNSPAWASWFRPETTKSSWAGFAYQDIYLGYCRYTAHGAIYSRELNDTLAEGRITAAQYDPTKPVNVYFDSGWADRTSIRLAQHDARVDSEYFAL
jgi:hypothetical protein